MNSDEVDHQLLFEDLSYSRGNTPLSLKSGETATIRFDLSKQYHWYDVRVTCKQYSDFAEQYAGRIETGKNGKSDPLLSRS